MKKTLVVVFMLAFSFMISSVASANEGTDNTEAQSVVNSITVEGVNETVNWVVDGHSSKGFKVIWSKNENPTYPTREGDSYHYLSSPSASSDSIDVEYGDGVYYVRVCEYLGGKCGKYSNQIRVQIGSGEVEPVLISEKLQEAVKAITLAGESNDIKWTVDGYSSKGFKVVWSKNENPTYPTREGDKYRYLSNPKAVSLLLKPFSGEGEYYVRVCEYLGGKCGKYSNQIKVNLIELKKQVKKEEEKGIVNSITLSGEGSNVKWTVDGYSSKGFKVVWSKNENPTYPTREGDKYHYRSHPKTVSDFITPFNGNGTYYVRVCEYLGGKCGKYSNQIRVNIVNADEKGVKQIEAIRKNTSNLFNNKLDALLAEVKELRNTIKEQQVQIRHLIRLKKGLTQTINAAVESAIKNFITYGVDDNTKRLGEGERAAVMYSYKSAFGKLPETEDELEDAIKIANGRWPSIVNDVAENKAKAQFRKIYLRAADMNAPYDAAAVKVMAYGLRQRAENRNLKSERSGLKIFKSIFHKMPETTDEWNTLQAITYSGAQR